MAKRKKNSHPMPVGKAKFQVIGLWLSMDNTEDNYEEGLIGGPNDYNVLFENNLGMFDSVEELIDSVAERTGASKDPTHWEGIEDGRIVTAFMVDENNYEPSDKQIEAWKRGEERLWSSDVSVGLAYANVWTPDEEALNDATVLAGKKASNPSQPPKLKSKLLR